MTFEKHVKFYIVGGYVRDRFLDRECHDHDFVVVGATPQDMLDNGFKQVGADFPVFLNSAGDEYALARTERKVGSGYHGFETDFNPSVTLEEDLSRRDLTINAMAREVLGWTDEGFAKLSDEIVDPFGGQEDLRTGVVRHVSEAFGEDPVRVLRAARFAARYTFRVADETVDLMKQMVRDGELDHLTAERVWLEMEKTMKDSGNPKQFFLLLHAIGALKVVGPELDKGVHLSFGGLTMEERFAVLTIGLEEDEVVSFFERMKAPSNVSSLALRINKAHRNFQSDEVQSVEWFVQTMEQLDGFRRPFTKQLVNVVNAVLGEEYSDEMVTFEKMFDAAASVSFKSLSEEQQQTLKGKEVGEAITKQRVQRARDCL